MSQRHTYKPLLVAGLPAVVSTNLATVGGRGNSITLEIITTVGGAGLCTFTLESSPDGGTNYFQVYDLDSQASWSINVNTAGKYELTLPVDLIPQQLYRLSYSCAVAAGTIAINAIRWENPAGNMSVNVGDIHADMSTLESAVHLEDAAHVSGDAGHMPLAVRNDVLASLAGTDGDYAPHQVNADGALYTEVVALPGGLTGYEEDTAHVTADIGIQNLAVRNDTLASLCDTDGDYAPHQVDADGALYTVDETAEALLITIDADTSTIAGDTTSIDAKTPALGTAVMASSSPVTIATDDTVATDLTAIKTAVEILDDWDETDRAAVNTIVGQAGVAANAGAADALTQRVIAASDDPGVVLLGTIDADTSTIAGDTTSIDSKTPALGTGVMAGSSPVTIASDDTQFGAIGAAADVDGNIHGQLRSIGEAVEIVDDWDAVHDSAVSSDGPQVMSEAKDFDGSALPNDVQEGDAVRPASSLHGIGYTMLTNKNGSGTPTVTHSAVIGTGEGTVALMGAAEAKDFDGAALPNSVTEGDSTRIASSSSGVQYVMPVSSDGSETPVVAESAAISAANGGSSGMMVMAQARDTQKAAVTEDDAVRPVANLNGELAIAGFDWTTETIAVAESDPLDQRYLNENILDDTNISATTHYYPSATGETMDGYADLSLTGKLIDADGTLTLTLECTNDEDTSGGDWVSVYFYDDKNNATVNSQTVTNGTLTMAISANNNNFRYFRWAVVASGATNTVILKQRRKAL